MSEVRRYQPVGRGETVPDKYGRYCKYEDVEHWIGMYNLCNEREQSLLAERNRLRELLNCAVDWTRDRGYDDPETAPEWFLSALQEDSE